jgi:hypothetical protein
VAAETSRVALLLSIPAARQISGEKPPDVSGGLLAYFG